MARTVAQIQQSILAQYVSIRAANGLVADPALWSQVDLRFLWSFIVSTAAAINENNQDNFKADVQEIIANTSRFHAPWYVAKMKYFRYGFNLVYDTDFYDDTGLTPAQIVAAQVIKYAAAVELQPGVRLKVATIDTTTNDLVALPQLQLDAAQAYAKRIKPFGIYPLEVTTGPADKLKLKLLVKFNPLVLDNQGRRIDGTNNAPVQDAIDYYLKNIIFNGTLELMDLGNTIEAVEGVAAAYITDAAVSYGALPFTSLTNFSYNTDAGYLRFYSPSDLQIVWQPYV